MALAIERKRWELVALRLFLGVTQVAAALLGEKALGLQALLESRLLLLFIEEGPAARGILTGKLFEYLGSGVPILALAPEGEAAELIRTTRGGRVVPGDDAEAVAGALREAFAAFRRGERPFGDPDRAAILRTSRPELTARLADLFRRVLADRALVPNDRRP